MRRGWEHRKADVPPGWETPLWTSTEGLAGYKGQGQNVGSAGPLDQLTLLSHVLVQHQLAMPEEVQDGPEVGGVAVNEVGPSLVLWR